MPPHLLDTVHPHILTFALGRVQVWVPLVQLAVVARRLPFAASTLAASPAVDGAA